MSPSTRARSFGRRSVTKLATLLTGALVLSSCSVYDVPLPGGADTGENPMKIKVMFRDVLDLVPQSTVKVDDVTVGKIKAVELKGYVAEVSIEVRKDLDLPDNARAEIRQTSLLGEKFVALSPPREPGTGKLSNNDVIGLDRTGRNPEVEEVLGALSLLLNGGGVGQLKTIASELNNTFGGRESEIRSVLTQMRVFVGQLDKNKGAIIAALENTNRLAVQLKRQDRTIKSALDNVPDTLRSVNRQRDDLVKLLQALERLSGVGVRVIKASKESTINSLRDLAPVLNGFAEAGDALPKALQVFLTYPFIDEAVGRDPQVARNIQFGDYTNLSATLDLELAQLPGLPGAPPVVCATLKQIRKAAKKAADTVLNNPKSPLPKQLIKTFRKEIVNKLVAGLEGQCSQPDPVALQAQAAQILTKILKRPSIQGLLKDMPGGADDIIKGLNSGSKNGGGFSTPGVPLGRAQLGSEFQTPAQPDPFGLATRGLDPGIGTILLQGVAEVR